MPTWLTMAAIARRVGRPVSTVRSWRDRYAEYVPEQTDAEGQRVYPLERIAEIQAMRARNLIPREIISELARRHEGAAGEEEPDRLEEVLTEVRAVREDIREVRALLNDLVQRRP